MKKKTTKNKTKSKKTIKPATSKLASKQKNQSKKIKSAYLAIAIIVLVAAILVGIFYCCKKHRTKKIFDGVLDAGTYTEIDYSYERKLNKERFDNWGGCTAIAKNIGDNTIIGRNMDLEISNKAAFVFRTDIKGKYKTINLAYTYRDYAMDYKDAVNGLSEDFYNFLPFISDDVMNEKGLYIEVNMRLGEGDKFSCSGTNPSSDERVYMFSLPIYIGLNAATVDEALDYIKTLDIYSKNGYWNYSFMIADATGRYGILEFANNKYYWNEGQNAQANFYVTPELNIKEKLKAGVGRYEYVREHIEKVQNKDDMFSLMNDIRYSRTYNVDAKFDVRSEFVDAQETCQRPDDDPWTYDYVMEDKDGIVARCIATINGYYPETTREERAEMHTWESTFTEVVDIKNREIRVRFFEDDNKIYTLKFNK